MEIVHLQDVHKWVGEGDGRTHILNGVSFTLHRGEFVAVMGASGSGKSSFLNIVGLLDTPSAGHVRIDGRDVTKLSENDAAALRSRLLGFVFQSFNLIPYLTALGNVELPMIYSFHPHSAARGMELLSHVHLEHRAGFYPTTLSGGERQRVAIARALTNEPALILADEPTGALDSRSGTQIMDILGELNRQGTAIILVTHDEAVARRAHRLYHMKDGRFE